MVLLLKITQFQTKMAQTYPFSYQNSSKTIPFHIPTRPTRTQIYSLYGPLASARNLAPKYPWRALAREAEQTENECPSLLDRVQTFKIQDGGQDGVGKKFENLFSLFLHVLVAVPCETNVISTQLCKVHSIKINRQFSYIHSHHLAIKSGASNSSSFGMKKT